MDTVLFFLQLAVVLGAIVLGTRSSGVALGLWGGAGVAVLVLVFRLPVGTPPVDALLIVLTVVLTASMMQIAGGIDWMVSVAANLIARRPKQITLIAPLVAFAFSIGAGTSNILYPLLPVIYDLSYQNGVRPSRPLSLSVLATSTALACSPVAAAMAAMITLTEKEPYNFDLIDILKITLPACIIGLVVSSIAVNRLGKDLMKDPEVQRRIAEGELDPPGVIVDHEGQERPKVLLTSTKQGRNAALIFLFGVVAILVFGMFKTLRPELKGEPIGMTAIIEMVMFSAGTLILLVCRPKVDEVPESSVFKAGMVSAIALFGLAWMTDTFISAHTAQIESTIGEWVKDWTWIFAIGMFLVCALTTSQSTATRAIVPIGLLAGISPALISGMWAGSFAGVYTLPANGTQIAAVNFDLSGTTHLGRRLYDHSFFVPTLVLAVTSVTAGLVIGGIAS